MRLFVFEVSFCFHAASGKTLGRHLLFTARGSSELNLCCGNGEADRNSEQEALLLVR